MDQPQPTARPERANAAAGYGAILIGPLIPLICYVIWGLPEAIVYGGLPMLVMVVVGLRATNKWRCGACKNPIASKDVRVCAACRATLG